MEAEALKLPGRNRGQGLSIVRVVPRSVRDSLPDTSLDTVGLVIDARLLVSTVVGGIAPAVLLSVGRRTVGKRTLTRLITLYPPSIVRPSDLHVFTVSNPTEKITFLVGETIRVKVTGTAALHPRIVHHR